MKPESVYRLLNIISLFNSETLDLQYIITPLAHPACVADHDPDSHSVLTQRGVIKVVLRKKFYCCSKMKCFVCPSVGDEDHM